MPRALRLPSGLPALELGSDWLRELYAAGAMLEVLEVPCDALVEGGVARHPMGLVPFSFDLAHVLSR
jgi:hypothetical protein